MKTNIIINFQIEALHYWKDAATVAPAVAFLQHGHRHMFHICCKKEITDADREIEIILFKRSIQAYLQSKYGEFIAAVKRRLAHEPESKEIKYIQVFSHCDFRGRSCEMISQELMTEFDLDYCSVMEDGENGAECIKTPHRLIEI